jgi:hypothetical protein
VDGSFPTSQVHRLSAQLFFYSFKLFPSLFLAVRERHCSVMTQWICNGLHSPMAASIRKLSKRFPFTMTISHPDTHGSVASPPGQWPTSWRGTRPAQLTVRGCRHATGNSSSTPNYRQQIRSTIYSPELAARRSQARESCRTHRLSLFVSPLTCICATA